MRAMEVQSLLKKGNVYSQRFDNILFSVTGLFTMVVQMIAVYR